MNHLKRMLLRLRDAFQSRFARDLDTVNGSFFVFFFLAFFSMPAALALDSGLLKLASWAWLAFTCWFRVHYWRCPHCGKSLDRGFSPPEYCPSCGKKIRT